VLFFKTYDSLPHLHIVSLYGINCDNLCLHQMSGSVAEQLAFWTQAQKGLGSYSSHDGVG